MRVVRTSGYQAKPPLRHQQPSGLILWAHDLLFGIAMESIGIVVGIQQYTIDLDRLVDIACHYIGKIVVYTKVIVAALCRFISQIQGPIYSMLNRLIIRIKGKKVLMESAHVLLCL